MTVQKMNFDNSKLDINLYRATSAALIQYTRNVLTTKSMVRIYFAF